MENLVSKFIEHGDGSSETNPQTMRFDVMYWAAVRTYLKHVRTPTSDVQIYLRFCLKEFYTRICEEGFNPEGETDMKALEKKFKAIARKQSKK